MRTEVVTTAAPAGANEHRTTRARLRALFPWWAVVFPWLVSRAFSACLVAGMAAVNHRSVMTEGFARWDGGYFIDIAKTGYGPAHAPGFTEYVLGDYTRWPFFPLLPATLRALHWLSVPYGVGGVVVNHLVFLVGLAGLYHIARRHVPDDAARLSVWICALGPFAFVFSMVYPSAIIFTATVWAVALVEEAGPHRLRNDLLAGVSAAIATLVRPNGVVVVVALVIAVRFDWRRILASCALPLAALGAWMAYNHHRTGDALTFYKAKGGWEEVNIVEFFNDFRPVVTEHLVIALVAITCIVIAWRLLPTSWIALAACYLLPSFFLGMHGLGRYVSDVFPTSVAGGVVAARFPRGWQIGALLALAAAQVASAYVVIYRVGAHAAAP